MPFIPEFVKQRAVYESEKVAIASLDDWIRFTKKWFPSESWPRKSADQIRAEAVNKRGPIEIGGRRWGYVTYAYDLSPEDRYEYVYTQRTIGDPLKYPDENLVPKTAADGWAQECPYSEITTSQIGDMVCPQCGRRLVYTRRAD